jgi:hypothetical protein
MVLEGALFLIIPKCWRIMYIDRKSHSPLARPWFTFPDFTLSRKLGRI